MAGSDMLPKSSRGDYVMEQINAHFTAPSKSGRGEKAFESEQGCLENSNPVSGQNRLYGLLAEGRWYNSWQLAADSSKRSRVTLR